LEAEAEALEVEAEALEVHCLRLLLLHVGPNGDRFGGQAFMEHYSGWWGGGCGGRVVTGWSLLSGGKAGWWHCGVVVVGEDMLGECVFS
jgi:hypothetical protein